MLDFIVGQRLFRFHERAMDLLHAMADGCMGALVVCFAVERFLFRDGPKKWVEMSEAERDVLRLPGEKAERVR